MSNNDQRMIYNALPGKLIAYKATLADVLGGSVKAGILMAQLLYWQGKGRNKEWTYKSAKELKQETGLSRREQDTAISQCKKLGVLDVKLSGHVPATRHFRVNIKALLDRINSLYKTAKLARADPLNKYGGNVQSITDSSSDNSQNNKQRLREITKPLADKYTMR